MVRDPRGHASKAARTVLLHPPTLNPSRSTPHKKCDLNAPPPARHLPSSHAQHAHVAHACQHALVYRVAGTGRSAQSVLAFSNQPFAAPPCWPIGMTHCCRHAVRAAVAGLRFTVGSDFAVQYINELPEPTLIHTHGLTPPHGLDGVCVP